MIISLHEQDTVDNTSSKEDPNGDPRLREARARAAAHPCGQMPGAYASEPKPGMSILLQRFIIVKLLTLPIQNQEFVHCCKYEQTVDSAIDSNVGNCTFR